MRELPHEGQLLAVDAIPTKAGGCAANVASGLSKQGITVDVAGCLGTDSSAKALVGSLEAHGVGCSQVVYSRQLPTSRTVILLVEGQDRRYIHSFGANAAFAAGDIDRDWVRSLDVFYLGGLFLMPALRPSELLDLLLFCRDQGVITVLDVVIPENVSISADLAALLPAIDYFLPNGDEARVMTGRSDPMEQLRAFLSLGANTVFITQGQRGLIAGRGQVSWQAGVYDMEEGIDPSGCGDAFAAGVVTGILRDWDMPTIIRYGSALGASALRALGTTDGVFTAAEAEAFAAANHLSVQRGIL